MSDDIDDMKQAICPEESGNTRGLGQDSICVRCGYSLHGLQNDGCCPECSLSVACSLGKRRLAYSNISWVTDLYWGYILLASALIIGESLVLMPLISQITRVPPGGWTDILPGKVFFAIIGLMIIMFGVGALLITIRDPASANCRRRPWSTRLIRPSLALAVLLILGTRAYDHVGPMLQLTAFISRGIWLCFIHVLLLDLSVLLLSALHHLGKLASRIPSAKLEDNTQRTVRNLLVLLIAIITSSHVSFAATNLWNGCLVQPCRSATGILSFILIVYFMAVILLVVKHAIAMKQVLRESKC